MQQRLRVDGDLFENASRVDADIFIRIKKDAFSKISGYVWTRPKFSPARFLKRFLYTVRSLHALIVSFNTTIPRSFREF